MVVPFPMIRIAGSPGERGIQYGRLARDRIAASVDLYSRALERHQLDADAKRNFLNHFRELISDFDPVYLEEMRGIAEGSGLDLFDIVLVNARTEMLQLAESTRHLRAEPDGCTGVVVLPEASRDGRLIHAQNWDWKAECVDTGIVLSITCPGQPDILTFTEAGALARAGLNSAGLAITANYLECDRDYRKLGVPLPLIRRKVLEQQHYAKAIKAIACTAKSASNNMMLSTAGGMAVDIECAPDESFFMHPEAGLLVHANHWVSPVALSKLRETGIESVPDSVYRDARVKAALATRPGRITEDEVKSALFDDWGSPYSVCRPTMRETESGNLSATVAMIVMIPEDGVMQIAPLPAENRAFTDYRIRRHEPGQPEVNAENA